MRGTPYYYNGDELGIDEFSVRKYP
ncbi:MAG: hypothetical protein WDM78_19735 [Puia sp.]